MRSAKGIGRTVGILLFIQLAGLILPFVLLHPIAGGDYLAKASGSSLQIKIAVLHLFVNGLLTIAICITAFPVLRQFGYRAPLWLLAAGITWFCMQAIDNAHILSMLSLSQRYVETGMANPELYDALGKTLRSTRIYIHYSELLVIDIWMALLYGILYRFILVLRLLAAFGLLAVVLHTGGITMSVFIGYSGVMPMG